MGRLRGPRLTAVLQGPGCNVLSRAAFRLPWGQGVHAVGDPFVPLLLNNRHPSPVFELFVPVGGGGMTSGIRRADSIGISF